MNTSMTQVLLVLSLGTTSIAAHSALETKAYAGTTNVPSNLTDIDENTVSTDVYVSASASGLIEDEVSLTGFAAAQGNTFFGGVNGVLSTGNSGMLFSEIYVDPYSSMNHNWNDTFMFYGSGSALFTFTIQGNMEIDSTSAIPDNSYKYAFLQTTISSLLEGTSSEQYRQSTLGTPGSQFGGTPTTGGFSDSRELYFVFDNPDPNSFTSHSFQLTVEARSYLSSMNYSVRLASITFDGASPDARILNSDGLVLASVTAVPEPETYGMMLVGLLLIGFVARNKSSLTVSQE